MDFENHWQKDGYSGEYGHAYNLKGKKSRIRQWIFFDEREPHPSNA